MNVPKLDYAEVYITNVCNYSCANCQSLNNFAFKGHQLWDDYKNEYEALSKQFNIGTVQIMGGEPLLNPDFEKWVDGISKLWPSATLEISTNGSMFDKLDTNIYNILARNSGTLWITCHDITLYDSMLLASKQFLNEVVLDYNPDEHGKDNWKDSCSDCEDIEQFTNLPENVRQSFIDSLQSNTKQIKTVSRMLVDSNGVKVRIDWSQAFVPSAIDVVDKQQLKMKFNSDPIEAHNICYFKGCHQINKGKVYKCPLVSVLPDFLNQFEVEMTDEDRLLAHSYTPLTSNDTSSKVSEFIENVKEPIPQCKFCPANYTKHNFVGTDKKIKIYNSKIM